MQHQNIDIANYSNPPVVEQGLITFKAEVDMVQLNQQLHRADSYFERATRAETLNVLVNELAFVVVSNRMQSPTPQVITKLNGFGIVGSSSEATAKGAAAELALQYTRSVLKFVGLTMSDTQDGPESEGISPTNGVAIKARGALSLYTPHTFKAGQAMQWYVPTMEEHKQLVNAGIIHGSGVVNEAITALVRPYSPRTTAEEFFSAVVAKLGVAERKDKNPSTLLYDPASAETAFFDDTSVLVAKFAKAVGWIAVAGELAVSGDARNAQGRAVALGLDKSDDEVLKNGALQKLIKYHVAPQDSDLGERAGGDRELAQSVHDALLDFIVSLDTAIAAGHSRCFATCTAGAAAGKRVQGYM
jgi:hypothetical protein